MGIEIGSIQMLQEFLGLPVTDPKELIQRPLEELSTLKKMLQAMVRDKKNP